MDLVQTVVSIVPVPYLKDAYSLLDYIYKSVQQVQASKTQLSILAETTARLLMTLNAEYLSGTIFERTTVRPLGELRTCVAHGVKLLSPTIFQQVASRDRQFRSQGA